MAANATNTTRVARVFRQRARELQRQTGLSDSSWSDQRDEARGGIREPVPQRLHVGVAAEKRRRSQGQRGVDSAHRRPRA